MTTQVNITLKAVTGNLSPSERLLNLNPDVSTIHIGRASKSPTKNLSAALNNAWFDSPVMSRNHAKLVFAPQKGILTIQDIGSMHGTYINNQRLDKGNPRELIDGDVLILGAEVKRGTETFPACAFQLNYEICPYEMSMSKGYVFFPDSSDIEDEGDYDFSDIEKDEKNTSLSDDGVSIEASSIKAPQSSLEPIDLTREDPSETRYMSDLYSYPHQVSLVTPPPAEHHSNGQPPLGHFQVPVVIANRNEPIILETDEEDGGFSTDSDDRSEIGKSESNLSSRAESFVDDDEGSDDNSDLIEMNDEPLFISSCDPVKNLFRSGIENEASDDEDSDNVSLSEAGREGIQALFDDGLLGRGDDDCGATGEDFCHLDINSKILGHVDFAPLENISPVKRSIERFLEHREPSPSDAAMVKPTATTRMAVNPIHVDQTPGTEWFEMDSQSLGEKTGKHAFFEARSYNKAKVSQKGFDGTSHLTPMVSESAEAAIPELSYHEPQPLRVFATPRGSWARRSRTPRDTTDPTPSASIVTIPTVAPLSYLDNHAQAPPLMNRDLSPEPDLTSAVKYNESKIRLDAANKAAASFIGRSRLSISDIIDSSLIDPALSTESLKRKAVDISSDDINTKDCTSTSPPLNDSSLDSIADDLCVNVTAKQSQRVSAELEVVRPAKRLRSFAQRLSYAALGGAAVGGALLSVLVATAPDYL